MAKHIFADNLKHNKVVYKKGDVADEKALGEQFPVLKKHGHIVEAEEKLVEVEPKKASKKAE